MKCDICGVKLVMGNIGYVSSYKNKDNKKKFECKKCHRKGFVIRRQYSRYCHSNTGTQNWKDVDTIG